MAPPRRHEPVLQPPALLRRWQTWAVLMAVLVIPFFLPIAVELRRHPLLGPLGDRLHIPLFTAIALMLYWRGPLRGRLWAAAVGAAAVGIAVELLQGFVGRAGRLGDFLYDLQGIGLALSVVWWRGYCRRLGLLLGLGLLALALGEMRTVPRLIAATTEARGRFPVLDDFEGRYAGILWDWNNGAVTAVVAGEPPKGGHVLSLTAGPGLKWPGTDLHHFPHDWTGYRDLLLDVRVVHAPADSLRLCVRVDDFQSRRDHLWLTDVFSIDRNWRTLVLPLSERTMTGSDRRLVLRDIDKVVVFTPGGPDSVALDLDNVRLR